MSEVEEIEKCLPKPKQYLLMADEMTMAILGRIMPGMLFVQVEGLAMQGNSDHMLLVNPLNKPPVVTQAIEPSPVNEQTL